LWSLPSSANRFAVFFCLTFFPGEGTGVGVGAGGAWVR
jgi:hypothetical protein